MGRPAVHFEIGCRDSQKTQEFYSKLFDWKIQPMGPAAMIASEPSGIAATPSASGNLNPCSTLQRRSCGTLNTRRH
jgi:predicted enzyme related to lactoylglutathione lyase